MSNSRQLTEKRQRTLRWLTHGVELALDFHGEDAKARHVIWCLLTESLDTMDKVPDQERRWLSSGTRSGGWSQIGMDRNELEEIERLRIHAAMSPFEEGGPKVSPQREAVARALDVLEWLRWTHKGEDFRLQKAACLLAQGRETLATLEWGKGGGNRRRQAVYEIRSQTAGRILRGLREDVGITPSPDGLRFQEMHDVPL